MYLHKENRELFRDAILLTSQRLEVSEDIVEKDYYVTLILKKLSLIEYPIVFKGGTSLSKAFQVIDRFSEDIDITFTEHLGEARRKKLKYNILKPIADELGLVIRNFDSIESDKNLNHYDFYYESVVGDRVINPIPPYVKLETSLMSYAFPMLVPGDFDHSVTGEKSQKVTREKDQKSHLTPLIIRFPEDCQKQFLPFL